MAHFCLRRPDLTQTFAPRASFIIRRSGETKGLTFVSDGLIIIPKWLYNGSILNLIFAGEKNACKFVN
jgi:hypothetical protein